MLARDAILTSIRHYEVLFWDFDGVIKESVDSKTRTYMELFEPFGTQLAARVRMHHECNGGMSRLEKIPLYLHWAGIVPTAEQVQRYCAAFAALVRQRVIDSAWVPGAREYLAQHHRRQRCVLVSATPLDEMRTIIADLGMLPWFREVHGAPESKRAAVASVLRRWGHPATNALLIGDSATDYEAARSAGVQFLLRRTVLNADLQMKYSGPQCEDFVGG